MRIIADTHILLWTFTGSDKLDPTARFILEDTSNEIYVSVASIWEVAIKYNKHPDQIQMPPEVFVKLCKKCGIKELRINSKHVLNLANLKIDKPIKHADPFDKIILSQAQTDNLYLLTHDSKLSKYNYDNILMV